MGFDARTDRFGLFVQFDQNVEMTISKLQIGMKTLATRFGGIIGVGKEFLWVLIFTFTSIRTLLALCKNISQTSDHSQHLDSDERKIFYAKSTNLHTTSC